MLKDSYSIYHAMVSTGGKIEWSIYFDDTTKKMVRSIILTMPGIPGRMICDCSCMELYYQGLPLDLATRLAKKIRSKVGPGATMPLYYMGAST